MQAVKGLLSWCGRADRVAGGGSANLHAKGELSSARLLPMPIVDGDRASGPSCRIGPYGCPLSGRDRDHDVGTAPVSKVESGFGAGP